MGEFDFRRHDGGSVPHDDKLADGINDEHGPAGLHAHMLSQADGIEVLINHLTGLIIVNANANTLCTPAVLALVVKRMADTAREHIPGEAGEQQRRHVIEEVQAVLDQMRAAD